MNEDIIIIILCVIASLLVIMICNYNRCYNRCYYRKQSKGITTDEMKIIIDDMDDFQNNKNELL